MVNIGPKSWILVLIVSMLLIPSYSTVITKQSIGLNVFNGQTPNATCGPNFDDLNNGKAWGIGFGNNGFCDINRNMTVWFNMTEYQGLNLTNFRIKRWFGGGWGTSGSTYLGIVFQMTSNFTYQPLGDWTGANGGSAIIGGSTPYPVRTSLVSMTGNGSGFDANKTLKIDNPYLEFAWVGNGTNFNWICSTTSCGLGNNNTQTWMTLEFDNGSFVPTEGYYLNFTGANFTYSTGILEYSYHFSGLYPAICNNLIDTVSYFNDTVLNSSEIFHSLSGFSVGSHNVTIRCVDANSTIQENSFAFSVTKCGGYLEETATNRKIAGDFAYMLCVIQDPSVGFVIWILTAVIVLLVLGIAVAIINKGWPG